MGTYRILTKIYHLDTTELLLTFNRGQLDGSQFAERTVESLNDNPETEKAILAFIQHCKQWHDCNILVIHSKELVS